MDLQTVMNIGEAWEYLSMGARGVLMDLAEGRSMDLVLSHPEAIKEAMEFLSGIGHMDYDLETHREILREYLDGLE